MKERPVLFSAPMVRAILDGSKTQTRRTWKLPSWAEWDELSGGETKGLLIPKNQKLRGWYGVDEVACPYGVIGDRLWVRESWGVAPIYDAVRPRDLKPFGMKVNFGADDALRGCKVRPAIHMPRWASRITLEIIGLRVERLQECSDDDALAEGIDRTNTSIPGYAKERYRHLWESINGAGSWDANPWVWVIKFRPSTEGAQ